jgi:hypothetical protein
MSGTIIQLNPDPATIAIKFAPTLQTEHQRHYNGKHIQTVSNVSKIAYGRLVPCAGSVQEPDAGPRSA